MASFLGVEIKRPGGFGRKDVPARPLTDKELWAREERAFKKKYLAANPKQADRLAERLLGLEPPDLAIKAQQEADAASRDADAAAAHAEAKFIQGDPDIGRRLAEARLERLQRSADTGGQFGQIREMLALMDELQDRGGGSDDTTLDKVVKAAAGILPAVLMGFAAKGNPALAGMLAGATGAQTDGTVAAESASLNGMVQPQLPSAQPPFPPTRPSLTGAALLGQPVLSPTPPQQAFPNGPGDLSGTPAAVGTQELTHREAEAQASGSGKPTRAKVDRAAGLTPANLLILPTLPPIQAASEFWELVVTTLDGNGPAAPDARMLMDTLLSPIPDDVFLAMMGAYAAKNPPWQPLVNTCQAQPAWGARVRAHLRELYRLATEEEGEDAGEKGEDAGVEQGEVK